MVNQISEYLSQIFNLLEGYLEKQGQGEKKMLYFQRHELRSTAGLQSSNWNIKTMNS